MSGVVNEGAQTPADPGRVGEALAAGSAAFEAVEPPPGYVWTYPPPPEPPWKAPRWLIVATGAWVLLLVVGAVFYAFHGRPTIREQSTIAGSQPVVDRAIVDVVAAAGAGPLVAVSGFQRVQTCAITPVRSGANYQRTVMFYVPSGTEAALLATIGAGLPAAYRARTGPDGIAYLYADAGDFVAITGAMTAPGRVVVKAITGCRPPGDGIAAPATPAAATPQAADVLAALGVPASSTTETAVTCGPGRGVLRTATAAVAPGRVPGPLDVALAKLSPAPVASSGGLFAYRTGGTDVIVQQDVSGVSIETTTRCDR